MFDQLASEFRLCCSDSPIDLINSIRKEYTISNTYPLYIGRNGFLWVVSYFKFNDTSKNKPCLFVNKKLVYPGAVWFDKKGIGYKLFLNPDLNNPDFSIDGLFYALNIDKRKRKSVLDSDFYEFTSFEPVFDLNNVDPSFKFKEDQLEQSLIFQNECYASLEYKMTEFNVDSNISYSGNCIFDKDYNDLNFELFNPVTIANTNLFAGKIVDIGYKERIKKYQKLKITKTENEIAVRKNNLFLIKVCDTEIKNMNRIGTDEDLLVIPKDEEFYYIIVKVFKENSVDIFNGKYYPIIVDNIGKEESEFMLNQQSFPKPVFQIMNIGSLQSLIYQLPINKLEYQINRFPITNAEISKIEKEIGGTLGNIDKEGFIKFEKWCIEEKYGIDDLCNISNSLFSYDSVLHDVYSSIDASEMECCMFKSNNLILYGKIVDQKGSLYHIKMYRIDGSKIYPSEIIDVPEADVKLLSKFPTSSSKIKALKETINPDSYFMMIKETCLI